MPKIDTQSEKSSPGLPTCFFKIVFVVFQQRGEQKNIICSMYCNATEMKTKEMNVYCAHSTKFAGELTPLPNHIYKVLSSRTSPELDYCDPHQSPSSIQFTNP